MAQLSRVLYVILVLYQVAGEVDETIRCTACQGVAGDPCDVSPWNTALTVPCSGRCITWRSLYANGRNLRLIWRGCEDTLFPGILSNAHKDSCGYGNFFIECTRTCPGAMCNSNHTGIPNCWSCLGDHRSCDLEPPMKCEDPVITTTTPAPTRELECVACQGGEGEMCDTSPYLATDIVRCNSSCITRKTLLASDRSLVTVWRGCESTLFPLVLHADALNSCHQADYTHIECTATCSDTRCNKYTTGFTECWTDEARKRPSCDSDADAVTEGYQTDLLDNIDANHHANTSTAADLPEGTLINCTACQGVAGDPCDVSPHQLPHTVPCTGACIARRSLYANGRALQMIWRGCDKTLLSGILDERFINTCQYGNFFVECTDTCRTGDKCNQNITGIPQCWSCLGDARSCDIAKETRCDESAAVTTTARPPRLISCLSCTGGKGDNCDSASYLVTDRVPCNSSCVTVRRLDNSSRELVEVRRGCQDPLVQEPSQLNNCIEGDNSVTCSSGCYDTACNKYTTGFAECWTNEGKKKAECENRESTTQDMSRINPSRLTTKKPYSIQDAYGGDNYRGEWRPTAGTTDVEADINGTTEYDWRSYKKWDLPTFGSSYSGETRTAACTAVLLAAGFVVVLAYL